MMMRFIDILDDIGGYLPLLRHTAVRRRFDDFQLIYEIDTIICFIFISSSPLRLVKRYEV